jgi:hypothetical protein
MKTTKIKELDIEVAVLDRVIKFKDLKIPNGFRLAYDWEYLCVYRNSRNILKQSNYWWCNSNKSDVAGLCRLNYFDAGSGFGASDWGVVIEGDWLRGVMFVKLKKGKKK